MSVSKSRVSKKEVFASLSQEKKNSLYQSLLEAITVDFSQYGLEAIRKVRKEKPEQYIRLVATVFLQENNAESHKGAFGAMDHLTDEQLLEHIRSLEEELRVFANITAEN